MKLGNTAVLFAVVVSVTGCGVSHQPLPSADVAPPWPASNQASAEAASPIDNPISGSREAPQVQDIPSLPSLESVMNARPGYSPAHDDDPGRLSAVKQAAWAAGATSGLAAESLAIKVMLDRNARLLDEICDFRSLVLPQDGTGLLLLPPVISEAEMDKAIDPSGQSASEADHVYRRLQKAQLVARPPIWQSWLTPAVQSPRPTPENLLPRTPKEVEVWRQAAAEGWAAGTGQAVDQFRNDLARLKRDIMGMARWRILVAEGKATPGVFQVTRKPVSGDENIRIENRDDLRVRSSPGLVAGSAP